MKTEKQTLRRPAPRPPTAGETGSLFDAVRRARPAKRGKSAPELVAARVLCQQLKRKRISADKKRLVHLICLNLLSILRRRSQQT